MILCALDFEATGLNKENDRILEVGLALYSTGRERVFECTSFLVNTDGVKITDEITKITGATQDLVEAFGFSQESAIETINEYFAQADAVIGHNIVWYDLPMLRNASKRTGINLALPKIAIDTMSDIPQVKGEKLITMCADAKDPKTGRDVGFSYTKHSALDDAKAVIRLISWHDIDKIVERANSPMLVILSQQGRDQAANKAARKAGFRWNPDFRVWWNAVKEMDVQALAAKVPFAIAVAPKEISLEQLRND